MNKNVASQKWVVFAFNRTTNVPVTGDAANITATINKDFAGASATNDTNPTELADGFYAFDMTQAETNANHLLLIPESSTSDVQVVAVPGAVYTTPANFQATGINASGHVSRVTLADTVTTYTGNTPQTGDAYAYLGTNLGALGANATEAGGTGDHLTALATAAAQTTAQNDLDILTGADGATLATSQPNYAPSKAGDAMALTSGERTTLTAAIWAALTSGLTTVGSIGKLLVDMLNATVGSRSSHSAADAATAVRTELTTELAHLDADVSSRGTADPGDQMDLVNAPNATAVTAIQSGLATQTSVDDIPTNSELEARTLAAASYATAANQTTILARLGSWTGTARNTILGAFQALFRSDSDASIPSDINADLGSGAGDAANTTDSLEAIRDRGDAAWTTGAGGGGGDCPTAAEIADAVLDEALSGHATAGTLGKAVSDILADTDFLQKAAEGDLYIDTNVTPWDLVVTQKGTGGPGVGTELIRKELKDVAGSNVTASTTVIGQAVEPA